MQRVQIFAVAVRRPGRSGSRGWPAGDDLLPAAAGPSSFDHTQHLKFPDHPAHSSGNYAGEGLFLNLLLFG